MTVMPALAIAMVLSSFVVFYAALQGSLDRRVERVAGGMSLFTLGMAAVTPLFIPPSWISTTTQIVFLVPSVYFLVLAVRAIWQRRHATGA